MAVIEHSGEQLDHFGHFSADGREYIITNIHTPRPWVNVMSNGKYGLVVSQSGGGFSWYDNCQLQRLTRWDQDLALDAAGRYVYIQDLDEPNSIWSTTFQPTFVDAENETVTYGCGYARYSRTVHGIRTTQTVFVDPEIDREFWIVEIQNMRKSAAKLRLASAFDWHLGGQGDWHREFHRLFMESERIENGFLAWKHPGLKENEREKEVQPYVAYHMLCGAVGSEFPGDKAAFYGSPADTRRPEAMVEGGTRVPSGRWDDPISSIWTELELAEGASKTVAYCLGAEPTREQALLMSRSMSLDEIWERLDSARNTWLDRLENTVSVETPDSDFNALTNTWFKYQTWAGRMDARCAFYQQGGAFGYRDQLQDSLLSLQGEPDVTLKQLGRHAEAMYEDGGVRHWWHPGFPIFVRSHHSDTCTWLSYGTLAYLDETNDLAALDRSLGYLNRETEALGTSATLLDHCIKGLDRALDRRSSRGLPLIQAGDWNDGLSHAGLDGKGESVWLAMFLFDNLTRWAPILAELGANDIAQRFRSEAENLRQAVETHAWDGDWYQAGTRDDGRAFGSKSESSGQIFLNTQTWAVITGIADPQRARRAIQSAEVRLFKPYGALLLNPAFSVVDPTIGYITRYAPGLRENGGVYSHASTWAVWALAKLGRHDDALRLWQAMSPAKSSDQAAGYSAEPYVMPGNVDGPDSPYEGRAGWTWYTGSSAWMVRVAIDWVLGVRASRPGLIVDGGGPVQTWSEYKVRRPFRGDVFDIEVRKGTDRQVLVNGEAMSGPLTSGNSRKVHSVQVNLKD
ncbi:MAG: glycosyl transferase family 36 [Armatimonadetes bacterium]|nr:glycosyl transferase family 36 [Armatimonadota bacterium]